MPYYFPLSSMKANCLTEGNRELFYLDDAGRVVRLAFEANDMVGRIFNGNKYKYSSWTSRNRLTQNYFHTHRRATIMDKIRHYSKVVLAEAKSYFSLSPEMLGLAYNSKK